MRAFTLAPVIVAITLGATPALAGSRVLTVDPTTGAPQPTTEADLQKYRGFMYDLSDYEGRKDVIALEDNLKHQLDIVENANFSPKVLSFFHSVPIVAAETDCLEEGAALACYGPVAPDRSRLGSHGATVWNHDKQQWSNPDVIDLAADSGVGVIMLRPNMAQQTEEPVLLHELLHAYHHRLMSNGFDNKGVKAYYGEAKAKDVLEKKSYTLKNEREFFAVTASIFLAGKSLHEPKTRAGLKEKMPDYYKYLVGLFGFDPDPSLPDKPADPAPAATPVASAAPASPAAPATPATPAAN